MSTAPEPDDHVNPPEWSTNAPFTAGAVHGHDPLCGAAGPKEAAARWKEMIPDCSEQVLRWIRDGGYTIRPRDESAIVEPARPLSGQAVVERELSRVEQSGAVELGRRRSEGRRK